MSFLQDYHLGPEPPESFHWRDGKYADWEVKLGDRTYSLHRVLLANGPRSCAFFSGACNAHFASPSSSDLSGVLPDRCHQHFERALDFVYGMDYDADPRSLVGLMKIADVLQCGALLRMCVRTMQHTVTDELAKEWLEEARALHMKAVASACVQRLINMKGAANLKSLETMTDQDAELCVEILSKDDLQVEEDDVAEFVLRTVEKTEDVNLQKKLWATVRFAGVSDHVLRDIAPTPANFEAMAVGLRDKCVGEIPLLRGSYWKQVRGSGIIVDHRRQVEFQNAGVAHSTRQRATIQLVKCENGAGSAIGFANKENVSEKVPCSEGGFAGAGTSGGYAISVFSNGLGNVWKNGSRLPIPPLKHVRDGMAVCATFDRSLAIVTFEVVGHSDEMIQIPVDATDLRTELVLTVSACSCGAKYRLL